MSQADYLRVEAALDYLQAHHLEQPTLDEVARHVGLSPFHFQRLFRRWAGVSPKRFLQALSAEHARALLADAHSVLDTAYDTGLSGPGRLHDLLVTVEAATPGEIKSGGEGLTLHRAVAPTPFGVAFLAWSERGICALEFCGEAGIDEAVHRLRSLWPSADLREAPGEGRRRLNAIFAGVPATEPFHLHLRGTNLQLAVWRALLRVPPGRMVAYGDVAAAVERPRAVRAVASAVGRNPVSWLIPCHRVIRRIGGFGEYRWGATRKRLMLGWEAARTGEDPVKPPLR